MYHFPSKQEAKTHYSNILNKYPLEATLPGIDFDYVMALLLNHPRANEKIGAGVKEIKISTGYNSNNRCFHVVRTDNSIEDFSIRKCIDGEDTEFHKFCIAARKATEPHVNAYKQYLRQKVRIQGGELPPESKYPVKTAQLIMNPVALVRILINAGHKVAHEIVSLNHVCSLP